MTDGSRRYLEVVAWNDYMHRDLLRNQDPRVRWCRWESSLLDELGDLTVREFGAYSRIVLLANVTGNRIPFSARLLKNRCGITPKLLQTLLNLNLVRVFSDLDRVEKLPTDQSRSSENARMPRADRAPIGKERTGQEMKGKGIAPPAREKKQNGIGDVMRGIRPNGRQPEFHELLEICIANGIRGSDWDGQVRVIEQRFGFIPSQKQHEQLQRQLNERAGK